MMIIHLVVGIGVAVATAAAALAFVIGWPTKRVTAIVGWVLGLLIVQAATGMFLLTATEEGPSPLHVVAPFIGLALIAGARFLRPEPTRADGPFLGAVFTVAAAGALVGLVTGLSAG